MAKFRNKTKPVEIEAVQISHGVGMIHDPVPEWIKQALRNGTMTEDGPFNWNIKTIEGTVCAERGDWIIRGVNGELYPCKPGVFKATYEPSHDAS